MQRKINRIMVLKELLKEKGHVRKISKKLNVSAMTVTRIIRELEKEDLIDYKKEGKNKTCFLKKSPSLFYYLKAGEAIHLAEIIKRYPSLHETIKKIKENNSISIAIIHSNYASKTASEREKPEIMLKMQKSEKMPQIEAYLGEITKSRLVELKDYVVIKGEDQFIENLLSNQIYEGNK